MVIFFLKSNPFVRFLMSLVLGILLSKYVAFSCGDAFTYLPAVVFVLMLVSYFVFKYSGIWLFGVLGFVFLLFVGFHVHKIQNKAYQLDSEFLQSEQEMLVRVSDYPIEKTASYKVPFEIEMLRVDTCWVPNKANVMAYFAKDSRLDSLKAGQLLLVSATMKNHKPKANPFDFDYGEYLVNKKVNYTAFVNKNKWQVVSTEVNGLKNLALGVRQNVLSVYREAGLSGNEYAVFSALTIGYKNDLDKELRESFAGAGAMHILAVSGMHVGIIYLILMQFFSLFGILKNNYKLQYILIVLGIWFYAFVTGLSPSVTRAVLMGTFILVGKIIGKRVDIFNSIAASAFILLLYNSNYLFDIGFQLSYSALISIVVFYKRIYGLLYFKYKVPDFLWQLSVVGVAAQIGTFPLSIFYFHQFPSYFWITGALVVMLAYVMMFGAVFLILVYSFQQLFYVVGISLHYITLWLEYIVAFANTLPFSIIEFFYLSWWQVLSIYAAIIFFTVGVLNKHSKSIIGSLVFVIVIMFGNLVFYNNTLVNNQTNVCYTYTDSVVQIINNGYCMWIVNDTIDYQIYDLIKDANHYYHISESKSSVMFVDDFIAKYGENVK